MGQCLVDFKYGQHHRYLTNIVNGNDRDVMLVYTLHNLLAMGSGLVGMS
jgi:hypothetical protein